LGGAVNVSQRSSLTQMTPRILVNRAWAAARFHRRHGLHPVDAVKVALLRESIERLTLGELEDAGVKLCEVEAVLCELNSIFPLKILRPQP